ncbi:DUF4232 domain-containing protein [Saccharomonospora xinjiangensis]|uniref:DUF4232 domain-containing protein n=1 Tax=Saccharomonospora xinjiangensis XJ-54 TaxID=882086 RepID=I0V1C1_9PSEU|nr:DUF4232 domain-containing protein [Saccharomonospora xinjiangensis]EID53924.1 hypothetical protein SacxiDRAFT_1682 [Saccharomonospora xinjiangensis XJ-54]
MKRTMTAHLLLATVGATFALAGCGSGGSPGSAAGSSPEESVTASATTSGSEATAPTSSTAGHAPSDTSTDGSTDARQPPQDPDFCTSGELSLSLGEGGGAAGTVYRPLRFTNVSDFPCVLRGFPGVSYVAGDDGHQVGKPAEHIGSKGPALTLYPGDVAHADVGFVQVRNYDTQACSPTEVRGLRVYPPQETASKFVEIPGTGCARADLHGNQLTVSTIEEGPGER